MKVLEQLAEFLVERQMAVLKSSSTWVPSPTLSLAHCEILGNCLGLFKPKLFLIMVLAPGGDRVQSPVLRSSEQVGP